MISSMAASITSSSSATVRVEKATSEFLIGPDWTMNMDICDTINSNQMLAKDVVKAVKKRLQHKNPKVQLLALTLLETMVKNCGEYVHFLIAEKNILQEMVKIVRKKTDMHVRDKILTLIGSWHEAFGGSAGRYPQYYMAYEDLRRSGVEFPRISPDSAPVFTPPVTHPVSRTVQPGYGMPSSSSTRLDEVMAAEERISLSSLNAMRDVVDLLADMLQAVDPSDRTAVKDEVIIDLVEQCRTNQKKLMQMLTTTGDEELLAQGLELNDSLQSVLAKHDAIASGSPLPAAQVNNVKPAAFEEHENSNPKPAEVVSPTATSNANNASPVQSAEKRVIDEDEEEEDDFAQLARRHSRTRVDASPTKINGAHPEVPSSPVTSNALVPTNIPASSTQTKDMDFIDLLSLTLSTTASTEESLHNPAPPSQSFPQEQQHNIGSATSSGITYSAGPYPGNNGAAFNTYVAPWAQPQPQFQSPQPQLQHQPQPEIQQQQPQHVPQSQYVSQTAVQPSPPQPQFPQYSQPLYTTTTSTSQTQQFQPQPEIQQQQPQHVPQSQSVSQTAVQPSPPQPQFPQYSQPMYTTSTSTSQTQHFQPQPEIQQQQPQNVPQSQYVSQAAVHPSPQPQFPQYSSAYPPPPWAATPGYLSNPNSSVARQTYAYSNPRPASSIVPRFSQPESERQFTSSPRATAPTTGQKPFIPSYRLFEDLDVFGNTDGRFKATSAASSTLSGSNNPSMVRGTK